MSRTTQAWIGVALILIGLTFDMLSDLFIRLGSAPINYKGTNPGSWDLVTGILLFAGVYGLLSAWFDWGA